MKKNQDIYLWAIFVIALLTIFPYLGLVEFNSKGEPREAVVALSMLKDGNWILPVNNGGDIPYKPPFLHWLIAIFSLPQGYVSEFTSRLPSALALTFMTLGSYLFYRRRENAATAFLGAMLTFTAFEVHRAVVCRVDMLLTAFIVGAFYTLYVWHEKGAKQLPWYAIVLMSLATLTKGPIGIALPCLVAGAFMLVKGERPTKVIGKLTLSGLLACCLPALWYMAAYQQGGNEFLELVKEENLGRLTGTMSYESHEHSAFYNLLSLLLGWLPWTILFLLAIPYKRMGTLPKRLKTQMRWRQIANTEPVKLFTWMAFLLTLLFYCIPASKRSVYLLPCYPFMGVLLAKFMMGKLATGKNDMIRVYNIIMAITGILLTAAILWIKLVGIPATAFHGKHAAENFLLVNGIGNSNSYFMILLPAIVGMEIIYLCLRKKDARTLLQGTLGMVLALYITLDGVVLPGALNTKSDKPFAEMLNQKFPHQQIYGYTSTPMLHFFCANFYANDRIKQFRKSNPKEGILMISAGDRKEFFNAHKELRFIELWDSKRRMAEKKDTVFLYFFHQANETARKKARAYPTRCHDNKVKIK